jgi:hypothetical protein
VASELSGIASEFPPPVLLLAELKESGVSLSTSSASREFFRIAATVLRFNWRDVEKPLAAQKIDAKPLKLRFVKLIVDCPKDLIHRKASFSERLCHCHLVLWLDLNSGSEPDVQRIENFDCAFQRDPKILVALVS